MASQLLLLGLLHVTQPNPSKVHLLGVGANQGLPGETRLRYAEDDAARYADALLQAGSLSEKDTRILLGPEPNQLLDAIAALSTRSKTGDVVHFYYSGHGDRASLHLGPQRLALDQLHQALSKVPARVKIVVIDACRRVEALTQDKGFARIPGFDLDFSAPPVTGTVLLHAASEGEAAQESSELQSAVFTHALVVGLRGAADVDSDARISLYELYRYAYRQTVLRSALNSASVMHPTAEVNLSGAGELIVAKVPSRSGHLLVPAQENTRLLVFGRPSGALLAELWSDPERALRLPLPAGNYLVHRRKQGQGGAAEIQMDEQGMQNIDTLSFHPVDVDVLQKKGGQFRLQTHEVSVAAGGYYRLGLGQSVRAGWSFGGAAWRLRADLGAGRSEYSGSEQSFRTAEIDGFVGGAFRYRWLELTVGGFVRALEVVSTPQDGALRRTIGSPAQSATWGAGGGPRARITFLLPSLGAFEPEVAASLSGLFVNEATDEQNELVLRPEAMLELGLRYEL